MRIDIVTLFPEICRAPLSESIMKRAQENRIVELHIHNLRDWTTDKHHVVDDAPFGGGQGMVMKPEPIFSAVEDLKRRTSNAKESKVENRKSKVVLMSPAGRRFNQEMARQLSQEPHLIIISGHYEGVDHRVIEHLIDLEISIGDYVLTNGAIAAVVLVDSIVRLLPGTLGHEQSADDDSFSNGLLEAPHTPGPPTSVVGKFQRFCSPGITQKSRSGVKSRQSSAPVRIARIYSAEDRPEHFRGDNSAL